MAASDYVKGMVAGGLVGLAVGLLTAPKSGRETREVIGKSTEDLLNTVKGQYGQTRAKLDSVLHRGKDPFSGESCME